MKKIIFSLTLILCIGFVSCSNDDDDDSHIVLNLKDFVLTDKDLTADESGGKYWKETFSNTTLSSQIFTFSHKGQLTPQYWGGFTVSNSKDNTDWEKEDKSWVSYQWSVMAKGGKSGVGTPFLVGYWNSLGEDIGKTTFNESQYSNWIKVNSDQSHKANGIYVCNSTWVYYTIQNGSAFSKKFAKGDYYKLKAYGVKADNSIIATPVEFYLADYRSANESEWKLNKTWEWMDLRSLGEVKYIYFMLESTDVGQWGINTPTYFCIDQLTMEPI